MRTNSLLIIFLLAILWQEGFAQVPVNGLKGYWKLDGNVSDYSGNNNNGSLQGGAVYCEDRFGVANSAVKFGGYYNSSVIFIPNSPSLSLDNELTIACWFKLDDPNGMDGYGNYSSTCGQTFIAKDGDRSGFLLIYSINPSEQNPTFNIYNNTTCNLTPTFHYDDVQSCINTEWIHVAVVVDRISIMMYINGMQKHRETYHSQITLTRANDNHLTFGRFGYNCGSSLTNWYPFNGKLDDIVYYNRALTQTEINALCEYPVAYIPTTGMITDTINDSVNLGEVYEQNGFSLPAQDQVGTFTYSRTNGCDSVWVLILNVNNVTFYANDVLCDTLYKVTFCDKNVHFQAEIENFSIGQDSIKWYINNVEYEPAQGKLTWNKDFETDEYDITMWIRYAHGEILSVSGILNVRAFWTKIKNIRH